MMLRAKHIVLFELIPMLGMMTLAVLNRASAIAFSYYWGIGMFAGFAIYLIIRANPDPNTIILGNERKQD